MTSFNEFSQTYRERVNHLLSKKLKQSRHYEQKLNDAMAYSLLSGGKRVRPLLVYAAALALGKCTALTDTAAAAVESIHAYSLIHDDLPAMDDDDLRRGLPTCHIKFGEATAILAGDALQTVAFDWLSEPSSENTVSAQLQCVQILAKASGNIGMVAGQAIDLAATDQTLSLEQLTQMHNLKTGALITASIQLGATSTGDINESQLTALTRYANAIGLAFQVQDDILDVTSDTNTLGKQQGADIANNKPTFVSLLGLEEARSKANALYNDALAALATFDSSADHLRHLAAYIVKRDF